MSLLDVARERLEAATQATVVVDAGFAIFERLLDALEHGTTESSSRQAIRNCQPTIAMLRKLCVRLAALQAEIAREELARLDAVDEIHDERVH